MVASSHTIHDGWFWGEVGTTGISVNIHQSDLCACPRAWTHVTPACVCARIYTNMLSNKKP